MREPLPVVLLEALCWLLVLLGVGFATSVVHGRLGGSRAGQTVSEHTE